ncbi:uncharacterized protein Tco_1396749 [Tanacetum coccineum]
MNAGFSLDTKVCDTVDNGVWKWPSAWSDLYHVLNQIIPPILNTTDDKLTWKDNDGKLNEFSVRIVWDTIRARSEPVTWHHIVWHSFCIPRHAFHLWLVMARKLKTQDKLKQWDIGNSIDLNLLCCPLCRTVLDSHQHLFSNVGFHLTYGTRLQAWLISL